MDVLPVGAATLNVKLLRALRNGLPVIRPPGVDGHPMILRRDPNMASGGIIDELLQSVSVRDAIVILRRWAIDAVAARDRQLQFRDSITAALDRTVVGIVSFPDTAYEEPHG